MRKYVIFNTTDTDKINYNHVLETSAATLRRSLDGSKTFVKYEGDEPACITELMKNDPSATSHNHEEILQILSGPDWTAEEEEI
jgi:hypothetical protein